MRKKQKKIVIVLSIIVFIVLLNIATAAEPEGPETLDVTANETKPSAAAVEVNTTGGYISSLNTTASSQNPHWKAFIGWVSSSFTLDDSTGSTIYNWSSTTSESGEVYATRNSSSINWSNINCSLKADLENENTALNHTSLDDNITATFSDTTHGAFVVASTSILANSCPTLNTYIDNVTQNTDFEEVALKDASTIVYATILEQDLGGYDGSDYDFQMLVPENGGEDWTSSTAYYIYVEIS